MTEKSHIELYQEGADLYWSGGIPDDWDGPDKYRNPFLAGWNHAAEEENQIEWFAEENE